MQRYIHVTHSSIQSSPDKRRGIRVCARLVRSGHTSIDVQKKPNTMKTYWMRLRILNPLYQLDVPPFAHPFSSILPLSTNHCSLGLPQTPTRTPHSPRPPHLTQKRSQAIHPRPYIIHQRPIQPIQERGNAPFYVVVPPTSIRRLRI